MTAMILAAGRGERGHQSAAERDPAGGAGRGVGCIEHGDCVCDKLRHLVARSHGRSARLAVSDGVIRDDPEVPRQVGDHHLPQP